MNKFLVCGCVLANLLGGLSHLQAPLLIHLHLLDVSISFPALLSCSASVLPRVDENACVEHRVDVGTEGVLRLEVALVNWAIPMDATHKTTHNHVLLTTKV